jgi:hypothetical protein
MRERELMREEKWAGTQLEGGSTEQFTFFNVKSPNFNEKTHELKQNYNKCENEAPKSLT